MSNSESQGDTNNTDNSSDEEWNSKSKKKNTRLRKSVRVIKKPKTYTSSEDDCSLAKNSSNNGLKRRKQPSKLPGLHGCLGTRSPVQAPTTFTVNNMNNINQTLENAAKSDAQAYDSGIPPHIWRIDGRALLQKFEPTPAKSKVLFHYKNTSVYTGWSEMDTDNYAVLKNIDFIYNTPQRVLITLANDEFKNILMESD